MIHKNALVHPKATIGNNVNIGPFTVIGENVKIANDVEISSHVVIDGFTSIDEGTKVFPFSSLGLVPQDLKYKGEKAYLQIGKNVTIREHVTVNLGTQGGGLKTIIGNSCLLMVGTHIAHDCIVGNNVIFANNATLAGHVQINDNSVVGGLSAIHQFVRIGEGAMIGGMSGVISDVIPFGLVSGNRARLDGLNLIGMKRSSFSKIEIQALRKLYKIIFFKNSQNFKERLSNINKSEYKFKSSEKLINFLTENSSRSICQP